MNHEVHVAFPGQLATGENPTWANGNLTWVGLHEGLLLIGYPNRSESVQVPLNREWVTACLPTVSGRFIVATADGLGFVVDGAVEIVHPMADENMRFNDGKCDALGRLWIGSFERSRAPGRGALYVWQNGRALKAYGLDMTLPNGIAWSPDNRTMYVVDSINRVLTACDFDLDRGEIASERPLFQFPSQHDFPDGIAVAESGEIWIAMYGSGALVRLSPEGVVVGVVNMPVSNPTSCAFGRDGELYVTTGRQSLSAAALEREPWAGSVLVVESGVAGCPVTLFDDSERTQSRSDRLPSGCPPMSRGSTPSTCSEPRQASGPGRYDETEGW